MTALPSPRRADSPTGWDARALLDALLESAPVGLIFCDSDLRLVRVSRTVSRLSGLPVAEHAGRYLAEVLPDLAPTLQPVLEQVARTGAVSAGLEVQCGAQAGRQARTWWCCFYPWRPAAGDVGDVASGVGGVLVDVTERHLVELGQAELLAGEQLARAELEGVRDRLAFVVHAGRRLSSSLDVSMTLATVSDLMLPRFGRWCLVDLWDGRQLNRTHVKGADSDPEVERALWQLPPDELARHPAVRSALAGRSVVVRDTEAAKAYSSPLARALLDDAGDAHAYACVPLFTRGQVIGVLTLIGPAHFGSRELSDHDDLPVIEQVAGGAAQSLENARLFDAEHRLACNLQASEQRQRLAAHTLQRSLLPASIHRPEHLELAVRYVPGAHDTEVGGDWYDVIALGPGRTALVIGDVMGRGLRAATLMGQVRTAVRAYARQDLAPGHVLELVDGLVTELGESEIVTCVYAVVDASRSTLTYASAGHLPLVLAEPDGVPHRLDHETGLPLGVDGCGAPEHVVAARPGTLVAFYTDGLVEHRGRDVDIGVDELVEVLRARRTGSEPLDDLCDHAVAALCPPDGCDDDMALLLARVAVSGRRSPARRAS